MYNVFRTVNLSYSTIFAELEELQKDSMVNWFTEWLVSFWIHLVSIAAAAEFTIS
jgi:hypothetical protein